VIGGSVSCQIRAIGTPAAQYLCFAAQFVKVRAQSAPLAGCFPRIIPIPPPT
jgi:hypothetical protein